ncbi:MAG: TfoX/Sxy family protein [Acidimicrobiales bacterium]
MSTAAQAPKDIAVEELVDDLGALGDITKKAMFGGYGVFRDGVMFAIVDRAGMTYLRGDEELASAFEQAGAARHGKMPYWQIPALYRDDETALLEWAQKSADVAAAAKS